MSSERRIKASRANGAKSRGPVTPEGKQISSGNSARHKLLSSIIVLRDENPETFSQLHASLLAEFNPQTGTQSALVETMAAARWRLMRIWAIERETLEAAIDQHDPAAHSPAVCVSLAFRDLANNSRTLDLLSRYESRFDRQFSRALNLFRKLASDPPPEPLAEPAPATVPSEPSAVPPVPNPNGSHLAPAENKICQTDLIPIPDTPLAPPNPGFAGNENLTSLLQGGSPPTSPSPQSDPPEPDPAGSSLLSNPTETSR